MQLTRDSGYTGEVYVHLNSPLKVNESGTAVFDSIFLSCI